MRTVKVKVKDKVNNKPRFDGKTLGAFLGATILVLVAGFIGVLSANAQTAKKHQRNVGQLTKFDRVIYWPDAERCSYPEQNMSITPSDSLPECYSPIPQKYALGYINATKYIEMALRKGKKGAATFYAGGKAGGAMTSSKSKGKDYLKFGDFFNGASYMGDLYDFRVYPYSFCGSAATVHFGGGNILIGHWHDDGSCVTSEWHFYPRGTLRALDELYYDPDTKEEVECTKGTPGCDCKNKKVKDPDNPKKTITVEECTYDGSAYRDADGNIIYTGVFREYDGGPIKYTAATMEQYLKSKENSVRLLGEAGTGVFNGTVAFTDIDSWGAERYDPLRGVASVFTAKESIERAKKETGSWVSTYCPDADENKICYYSWGGGRESSPTNTESWMWFTFSSSNNVPFSLVYSGGGHGSMIESSTFTIAHVIKDDLSEVPDQITEAVEEFKSDYRNINGKDLSEDDFFKTSAGADVDPDQVLRLFKIYQYADYDPYTMNDLLKELLDGLELNWYSCEEMTEACKIPHDPDHNKGTQTNASGETYVNGYDFVSNSRVYYASVNDVLEINFDNTCYSGNNNPVEVEGEK
ncbi:hypothetical protein IKG48_01675 [Candidatus Saccharibacteria bacterium]|nr:hypothetical protein [Candidatus Saccharibacteria bacterium]